MMAEVSRPRPHCPGRETSHNSQTCFFERSLRTNCQERPKLGSRELLLNSHACSNRLLLRQA
jgi:hypothetical protein